MSTTTLSPDRPVVLADLLPRTAVRDVSLVIGAALLTALCAQIEIPVPGSPVPISGQTFAVVLTAAPLGARRGASAQLLYVLLGLIGLPFYSGGDSGTEVLFGATGGYLVGFVLAAWIVGTLAERGQDRRVLRAIAAFILGQGVIFAIGVPWLAVVADLGPVDALQAGLFPFVLGGLIKAALAGGLMPAAWRIFGPQRDESGDESGDE